MADIRYVVLSDLHFGEVNSVLTDLVDQDESDDLFVRSPRLDLNRAAEALIECVIGLAASTTGSVKPTLVLNGDIFELALAPRGRAFEVFDQFISHLMANADHPFDNRIIYLPGNHDHDLWDTVRDEIDLYYIESRPPDARIPGSVPITAMLGQLDHEHPLADLGHVGEVESRLLTRLLRHRNPHLQDLRVTVAYPNLALTAGDRMVILHHGHFLEPTYVLMTDLASRVFDEEPETITTWDLEIDNGPWLNFIWSSLGREGPVGDSVRRSYDMIHTEVGRVLLAERIANGIIGDDPTIAQRIRRWALRTIAVRTISRLKDVELRYDTALKPAVDEGLGTYLEGPVAAHLWYELDQRGLPPPNEVTFVFGHTHQPFASRRPIGTLDTPLRLYNTGGWVVDAEEAREKKGGAIVVLDDELDAALVRVFRQDERPGAAGVTVEHADGPVADSDLQRHLRALVDSDPRPWNDLRREVGAAIGRRRSEHRGRLAREIEDLTDPTRFSLSTDRLIRQAKTLRRTIEREVTRAERAARRLTR